MSKAIVIDFEGTLSDDSHRSGARDWNEYHALISRDKPIEAAIALAEAFRSEYEIVVISTTPEKYRQEITKWLLDNEVECDKVLLPAKRTYDVEAVTKTNLLKPIDVFIVFDDNASTVQSLRDVGYTVMEV